MKGKETITQRRARTFADENYAIVNMLELFEGKVSLTEILSLDLNRLNGLVEAKQRFNVEKFERRQKAKMEAELKANQV